MKDTARKLSRTQKVNHLGVSANRTANLNDPGAKGVASHQGGATVEREMKRPGTGVVHPENGVDRQDDGVGHLARRINSGGFGHQEKVQERKAGHHAGDIAVGLGREEVLGEVDRHISRDVKSQDGTRNQMITKKMIQSKF